jgi:Protein of unknown function (DUF3300)
MITPLVTVIALLAVLVAPVRADDAGYTAAQLDDLLGPIALYPDPLVSLILPASAVPGDVQSAAAYLENGGDPSGADQGPWDPSVRALAHTPTVLEWMGANLTWTEEVGAAFSRQPTETLHSIQELRAAALAAGNLVDTPQQHVEIDGDQIRILPVDQTVYVPQYDASTIYDDPYVGPGVGITFAAGYDLGPWFDYDCDWDAGAVWVSGGRIDWRHRRGFVRTDGARRWHVDASRVAEPVRRAHDPGSPMPRPGELRHFPGEVTPGARPPETFGHSRPVQAPTAPASAAPTPERHADHGQPPRASVPAHSEPAPHAAPQHQAPQRTEPSRADPGKGDPRDPKDRR